MPEEIAMLGNILMCPSHVTEQSKWGFMWMIEDIMSLHITIPYLMHLLKMGILEENLAPGLFVAAHHPDSGFWYRAQVSIAYTRV